MSDVEHVITYENKNAKKGRVWKKSGSYVKVSGIVCGKISFSTVVYHLSFVIFL